MIRNIFEFLVALFDVFNNPIGYTAVAVSIITGVILCIFKKTKILKTITIASFVASVIGFLLMFIGKTVDSLLPILFFFPMFVIMTIITLAYCLSCKK